MNEDDALVLTEEESKKIIQKGYKKAEKLLERQKKVEKVLLDFEKKMKELPKGFSALANLPIMASMINHYISGKYKEVPVATITYALVAILYVLTPTDIIPDIIPGVGYLDDVGIVLGVLPFIKKDLDNYIKWRDVNIE